MLMHEGLAQAAQVNRASYALDDGHEIPFPDDAVRRECLRAARWCQRSQGQVGRYDRRMPALAADDRMIVLATS